MTLEFCECGYTTRPEPNVLYKAQNANYNVKVSVLVTYQKCVKCPKRYVTQEAVRNINRAAQTFEFFEDTKGEFWASAAERDLADQSTNGFPPQRFPPGTWGKLCDNDNPICDVRDCYKVDGIALVEIYRSGCACHGLREPSSPDALEAIERVRTSIRNKTLVKDRANNLWASELEATFSNIQLLGKHIAESSLLWIDTPEALQVLHTELSKYRDLVKEQLLKDSLVVGQGVQHRTDSFGGRGVVTQLIPDVVVTIKSGTEFRYASVDSMLYAWAIEPVMKAPKEIPF